MNKRYLGIALIIVGVALMMRGYNVYNSVGSQISRTFNGDVPFQAWVGLVGGAICLVIGILKVK